MKILKWLFILLVIGGSTVAYLGYQQYQVFLKTPVSVPESQRTYSVKKGSHFLKVAGDLEQRQLISSADLFRVLAKTKQLENKVKAGEYALPEQVTPSELLDIITSGKALQYQQAIIEGRSFKEIIKSVKANVNLVQTMSDGDYEQLMVTLGAEISHPEGLFFPDTYHFPKGTTDKQFFQRSYDDMQNYIATEWEKRTPHPHIKTPYEALILASIVEKETGHPDERGLIARVFLNRLEKGMMLQTDPTVIYGMGDAYDGNIRKRDLKKDTPYNTYTRYGLPPTPIAIPGKAAINAVLHPVDGDALYFVAKGNDAGESYFSKTYAEHRKAVIRYQLNGNASRYQGDK